MKKWLNDGHGAYTYYSAQLAKDIDGLEGIIFNDVKFKE